MKSSNPQFLEYLELSNKPLLSDGGMGTMLNASGVRFDQCLDALNLSDPDLVVSIHQAYLEAGAEVIQTNTFGANRYKLSEHGFEHQLAEINQAGVYLARRAADGFGKNIFIAGDVGPLGVRIAPYGRFQVAEASKIFQEQIEVLCRSGVDLLIIETISDLNEMLAAIKSARKSCNLPVVASMTFTRDDRTILGDSPEHVALQIYRTGADIIGVNCSGGPAQIERILNKMHNSVPQARLSAMPNAGFPEQVGGRFMYPASSEYFGEYSKVFRKAGASLIGGCCGTTPSHISEMRRVLDEPWVDEEKEVSLIAVDPEEYLPPITEPRSSFAEKLARREFVVSVEMDPPRGLGTHKLLAGASLLAESGADVINIADSPMARMRMSPWAVCSLVQREINIETVLHFPTRGRNLLRVQGDLLAAHAMEIRNIFVVMGDPTAIGDYPEAMDDYDLVPSGLINLIKCGFNLGKDHSGEAIGQPTSFFVGCALNLNPRSIEREINTLHRKIKAGVDFILTQPIFEPRKAELFLAQYMDVHGEIEIPLVVGVLPLYNTRHTNFLANEVPGIEIPESIKRRMSSPGSDSAQEGVRIAVELVEQMRSFSSGIYLMPAFNRYDLAVQIIDQIK